MSQRKYETRFAFTTCQICTTPIWRPESTNVGICLECRTMIGTPIPKALTARQRLILNQRIQLAEDKLNGPHKAI